MTTDIKSALKLFGLFSPIQKLNHRYLLPRGFGNWNPLIPEKEFSASVKHAIKKLLEHESPENFGDYLEFGVSRGSSMANMYHVLRELNLKKVRLIGFDSFEGMPPESSKEGWEPGSYFSTLSATQAYLKDRQVDMNLVTLIKGWFTNTLNPKAKERLNLQKASVIMIDCDIYSASKTALEFVMPLIKEKALIIFDDWGWTADSGIIGQKEAFEESLKKFPEYTVELLPGYIPQSRIFLLKRYSPSNN